MFGKIASLVAISCLAGSASATVLQDDFSGTAGSVPNSTLWDTSTFSPTTVTLDGAGHLVANLNLVNSSWRTMAVSKATDLNPFASPLKIDLKGIVVGGTTDGIYCNTGFIVLGRSSGGALGNYYPSGLDMGDGFGIMLRKNAVGEYDFMISQFSTAIAGDSEPWTTVGITGTPTDISLLVDGANKTMMITIDGATYTAGGTSYTYTFRDDYTLATMSADGTFISRLSFGALNWGPVTSPSTFSVDEVSVSNVPEPATLVIATLGLAMLACRRR